MTTLAGCFERAFAAVIKVGPRNELPRPAKVKPIQMIKKARFWWEGKIVLARKILVRNEVPARSEAKTAIRSRVNLGNR